MRRWACMAAAWVAACAWGRELPVQRDYVRPMEFGAAEEEDLRAAPDVALEIEKREEFARALVGGKEGLLELGKTQKAVGAGYYSDLSEEGKGQRAPKKDDWLVKSVSQGFGGGQTNRSVVKSVLGGGDEEGEESRWGWLAAEMEQRQDDGGGRERLELVEEGVPPGAEEMLAEGLPDVPARLSSAGETMAERDARREKIRNAEPDPGGAAAFAGMQRNLEDIRGKLAVAEKAGGGGRGAEVVAAPAGAGPGGRGWAQPVLGSAPVKVTRSPHVEGIEFGGLDRAGARGVEMGAGVRGAGADRMPWNAAPTRGGGSGGGGWGSGSGWTPSTAPSAARGGWGAGDGGAGAESRGSGSARGWGLGRRPTAGGTLPW